MLKSKANILVLALMLTVTLPALSASKDLGVVPSQGPLAHQTVYENSYALLIGINNYPNLPSELQLHYAVNDANAMREVLVRYYGFPASHIRMLLNEQATLANIHKALAAYTDQDTYHKDDRILIYFSGHGQTITQPSGGEIGFLIPSDAKVELDRINNPEPYFDSCFDMKAMWNILGSTAAKHVLLIADACYSGLLTQSRSLRVSPGALASMASRRALQVMTAGGKGEKSLERDDLGHGVFTYKLIEELTARAKNSPGDVFTASELYAAVERSTEDITNGDQNPQFGNYETEGNFLFIATKPQPVPTLAAASGDYIAPQKNIVPHPKPADTPEVEPAPKRQQGAPARLAPKPEPSRRHSGDVSSAMHNLFKAIQECGANGSDPSARAKALQEAQDAIDDGADPNGVIAEEYQTPLVCALSYECEPMVKFLIDHGADVNKADPSGMTPLKMSNELGGFARNLLIQSGASD